MRALSIGLLIVLLISIPAVSLAQTDTSFQINTLLTQIIALQKNLIESLQNQIQQMQNEINNMRLLAGTAQQYTCPGVEAPLCSTTLTVARDSHNCPTSYFCAPTAVATQTIPTYSSCIGFGGKAYAHGASAAICDTIQNTMVHNMCPNTMDPTKFAMLCQNGSWVLTQPPLGACYTKAREMIPDGGTVGGLTCRNGVWY